jgi:hypothetical protein
MKNQAFFLAAALLFSTVSLALSQDLKGAIKGAPGTAGGGRGTGGEEVAAGRKEPIAAGTVNAVQALSKSNGTDR